MTTALIVGMLIMVMCAQARILYLMGDYNSWKKSIEQRIHRLEKEAFN